MSILVCLLFKETTYFTLFLNNDLIYLFFSLWLMISLNNQKILSYKFRGLCDHIKVS